MAFITEVQPNVSEANIAINSEDQESVSAKAVSADANSQEDHTMVTAKNDSLSRLLALYCLPVLELRERADGQRFITVRKQTGKQKDWDALADWLNAELQSGFVRGVSAKPSKRKSTASLNRLLSAVETVLSRNSGGEVFAMPVAGEHGNVIERG